VASDTSLDTADIADYRGIVVAVEEVLDDRAEGQIPAVAVVEVGVAVAGDRIRVRGPRNYSRMIHNKVVAADRLVSAKPRPKTNKIKKNLITIKISRKCNNILAGKKSR